MFIDIETVGLAQELGELDPVYQRSWSKKAKQMRTWNRDLMEYSDEELYTNKSGIYSEFSKIVCISIGYITRDPEGALLFKSKSFAGHNEKVLLGSFVSVLSRSFDSGAIQFLAGHNIREFDIPFIGRRLLVNKMRLASCLDLRQKKPWQIHHLIDTLELWKFGDHKHYCSLELLCHLFAVDSPKSDLDGSRIHMEYYTSGRTDKISEYCEQDVFAAAKLFLNLACLYPESGIELSRN